MTMTFKLKVTMMMRISVNSHGQWFSEYESHTMQSLTQRLHVYEDYTAP